MIVALLRQPRGATMASMMAATQWKSKTVSGVVYGVIKRGLRLNVISEKTETGRRYRIAEEGPA